MRKTRQTYFELGLDPAYGLTEGRSLLSTDDYWTLGPW